MTTFVVLRQIADNNEVGGDRYELVNEGFDADTRAKGEKAAREQYGEGIYALVPYPNWDPVRLFNKTITRPTAERLKKGASERRPVSE